jgi:hypothetical protein
LGLFLVGMCWIVCSEKFHCYILYMHIDHICSLLLFRISPSSLLFTSLSTFPLVHLELSWPWFALFSTNFHKWEKPHSTYVCGTVMFISHDMMISSSIRFPAYNVISLFLLVSKTPLCMCTTFSLSIHQLMGVEADSIVWAL